MLSFFKKDPVKKLSKDYYAKLEDAMQAQRRGDIRSYATLTAQAEDIRLKIEHLKDQQGAP